MNELLQFFIETASISGNHLAGMLFAAAVFLAIIAVSGYQILDLIFSFFRSFRPIKIKRVERIDKVVEVPTNADYSKEFKEIMTKLKTIEQKQGNVQL